jgi:hypothetical protein
MRVVAVAGLVVILLTMSVMAEPSALSFAAEFGASTLVSAASFDALLFRTFGDLLPVTNSSAAGAMVAVTDLRLLFDLALTPLAAGATVTCVGWAFGITGHCAGLASVLAASVSELFALRVWDLNLPSWIRMLAVPTITALGATIAFNLQATAAP